MAAEEIYKEGDTFFRPLFKDYIHIKTIQTHVKEGRLKTKLATPIYTIQYLINYKPAFTTYLKDIQNMVSFNRWIKTSNT